MAEESGAAVAEPTEADVAVAEPAAAEPKEDKKPKRQPRYNVLLWNDEHHSYDYVITMLQELFGFPPEKGYQLAKEVDTQGRVVVLTTTREHAELKRDQIHAYGKDRYIQDCKGSMFSTIEPEI